MWKIIEEVTRDPLFHEPLYIHPEGEGSISEWIKHQYGNAVALLYISIV